jgi:hypothetical protein
MAKNKVHGAIPAPIVTDAYDEYTRTRNRLLSPRRTLRLSGSGIKIAGLVPIVGIGFINAAGDSIDADLRDMTRNEPDEIAFRIPDLPDGPYQVRVTTAYAGGAPLDEPPRSSTLPHTLWVGAKPNE